MLESRNSEDTLAEGQAGGMRLDDIYFVLFRRKWIILFFFLMGLIAASVLYVRKAPVFQSDSKLLVRYVVESKSPLPLGDNSQVRSPDAGNNGLITSETEILTSLDLCVEVAEAIGPAAILKSVGGGDNKFIAGSVILQGIKVEPRGNIMKITFRHPDANLVKPVLERVIDQYLKRHAEIHRGLGSLDMVLSRESDQLKSQLNQTEDELRKLKSKAGIISLEETKSTYIQEMSSLRRELFNTEAALAESRAAISSALTNAVKSTNAVAAAKEVELDVPPNVVIQYREIVSRLAALRNQEFALQLQFSDENALLKRAREQVAELDQQRKDLEERHAALVKASVPQTAAPFPEVSVLALERGRARALEAKIKSLNAQLENVRAEAAKLDEIETPLKQLQRKRDLDEANFRYFSAGLERSRFDEALGSSRHSNISVVQNPTPPHKDDIKRLKMIGAAAGGGLAMGLAIAFFLELLLDRTVRRAPELESRLQIPLFMAIPYVNGKAMRALARNGKKRLAANGAPRESSLQTATACELDHPLRPIFEGLRDRTTLFFKNVTHKPKLVGVSGCSDGAGATTLAAGLAAALSETGDGKVLLVDMHQPHGAAHPFFKGKRACEIDDVLQQEKRQAGMVQENLYVAADSPERRLGLLARRFSHLMPKLKASDYDYIIFDMPRVSAISPALRLAGVMDLNLLVVEAQKVPRVAVKEGYSLLMDTGAEAQVILNKVRSYVPAKLSGEL